MLQHFNMIYVLMESKSEEAYNHLFEFLREELAPQFRPTEAYTDFEAALINSLLSLYEQYNLKCTGCWFHFAKVSSRNVNLYQ
jgi:hypothetical protein